MPAKPNDDPAARYREAGIAIRVFLAGKELTKEQLAATIGITASQFSAALCLRKQRFSNHRHRLRIERAVGRPLWNAPLESEQLAAIGKKLRLDMLTAPVLDVKAAAVARGVEGIETKPGEEWGFPALRRVLLHFFPGTPVADLPHYQDK